VEGRVDRVAREPAGALDVVQESVRPERQFEDVMEQLPAGAVAEPHPELA